MKSKDKRKNVTKQPKGKVFHPEHIHADYLEYYLKDFTSDGTLLNQCCGNSKVGDTRTDIDPSTNCNRTVDLFKVLDTFDKEEFDYVYCDPPFKFYTAGPNRFRWQFDLFKLCRIALITRRPKVTVNMPSKYHDYVILEDSRPSISLVRVDWR